MRLGQRAIAALIACAGVYCGLQIFGACRWTIATRALLSRLDAGSTPARAAFDIRDIGGLPAPVRRYFGQALTDGQPVITTVDLTMTGTFNLQLDAPQWKPFTAQQHITTARPGFVWDARIAMYPTASVHVHDAYIAGEGILHPAILGLMSLGRVQGKGEIARGELMRWLAEAVWYPTALLPRSGMVWTAVDATSARVRLTDGPITLTMLFRFNSEGLVCGIRVEDRGGLVDGKTVMMPWEGSFRDYRPVQGMLIPFHAEVAWITPEGEKPYFRGDLVQVDVGFGA